mgnify:CR=1 FL=1
MKNEIKNTKYISANLKNSKNRWKNIWFWTGVIGIILTACGIDGHTLTSWGALYSAIKAWLGNPYLIGSSVLAFMGTYVDPTTGGLKD